MLYNIIKVVSSSKDDEAVLLSSSLTLLRNLQCQALFEGQRQAWQLEHALRGASAKDANFAISPVGV